MRLEWHGKSTSPNFLLAEKRNICFFKSVRNHIDLIK